MRFYTGKSARPVLDEQGFASYAFTQIDEERIDEIMFSQSIYSSRRRPVQLQALLREWLLGTLPHQVTDLTDILANWQPDVVISETSMLAPMLVLRDRDQIPVAVFSTVAACLLPGADAPPYGIGLPRPRNAGTRLLASAVRISSDLLGAKFRRTADELRGRYGLPPLKVNVTEYTGTMRSIWCPAFLSLTTIARICQPLCITSARVSGTSRTERQRRTGCSSCPLAGRWFM